jgi:2-polyprenyl-3-methyl-5-hydroxy-6-metoxy-1,4-benzoquinol methylase
MSDAPERDVVKLAGEEYVAGAMVEGHFIHERSDALRDAAEQNVIEMRYGYAIRCLKRAGAKSVLDLGCGLGYGTWLLDRAGLKAEGVDLSEDALKTTRARYPWMRFHQGDMMTFEHEPVEGIVAMEIIEHVSDVKGFLRAAHRLLKPGGILVVSTPNAKYSGGSLNIYHEKEYTPAELRELLPGVRIQGMSTKLLKPARLWIRLLGEIGFAKFNFRVSLWWPFHALPEFARTLAFAATREDLERAKR